MTSLNNGRIIKISIGNVNQPIVEDIVNEEYLDTAVFGEQYRNMLSMLNQYVKSRLNGKAEKTNECSNNVFAFVGERGSGKTSCMSSVSKLLGSTIKAFSNYPELRDAKFASIDIIDPTFFDRRHNIVATVVAKLYKSFKEKSSENRSSEYNFDEERRLTEAFFKAQHSLRCLLDDGWDNEEFDDIENLSDLSLAVDLKNDISALVDSYLRFVKKENGFLVLSVDDIDLNLDEADTMAEQIRKYLVSPNIIILFAAKLDQLGTIKKLHYSEKYKYLLEKDELHFDTIEQMTSHFLTKMVPHDQRVYMPEAEYFLDSGIIVENDNLKGNSVRQAIPELIFNRTRYLFYNSKQTPSYIIPRNLRKMCQLVAMLWTMPAYSEKAIEYRNKSVFRNYLFGTWMQDNLSSSDRERINKVLEGWRNDQLNVVTLEVIRDKYKGGIHEFVSTPSNLDKSDVKPELTSLFDNRNRDFNISVGDIMSLIYILQNRFESQSDKSFFFIISAIYSIALYEKYDLITEEQEKKTYNENEDHKVLDDGRVLLYDPFDDEQIWAYHKLVGGRFFNYRLAPVLPKEIVIAGSVSRSDRMINFEPLMQLTENSVSAWKEYKNLDVEKQSRARASLIRIVRLAEFFMLCSSRDISTRNRKGVVDYYDPEFRQSDMVTYNGEYSGIKHLYFDLGCFLYNITNIRSCYHRFRQYGKELFELCYSEEGYEIKDGNNISKRYISLYASFRHRSILYRGPNYTMAHSWQSWASIRNMEILFDINQRLRQKRYRGTNRQMLQQYFKTLSDYSIRTYDRDEADSFYSINFEFAEYISNLLSDNEIEGVFNDIFNIELPSRRIARPRPSVMTMDPALLVDTEALLRGRAEVRNKKSTVLKSLREKQPRACIGNELLIRSVFDSLGDYITRDEIRQAAGSLNALIMNKYGSSQGNTENIVSSAKSESAITETEE